MKDSDVYLAAAKRTDQQGLRFSCCEIDRAVGTVYSRQREEYARLFAPRDAHSGSVWGEGWASNDSGRKSCRLLALLFMSAIAASEGR